MTLKFNILIFTIALSMGPGFTQYIEDFSSNIDLEQYVLQRYDGTPDTVWSLDQYQHLGPFSFTQSNNSLNITSEGYWEWDYVVFELPEPIYMASQDKIKVELQMDAGSQDDSVFVSVNIAGDHEKGLIFQPVIHTIYSEPTTIEETYWASGDEVSHVFININAGYFTGPDMGWFTEPTAPFVGTLSINSITIDESERPVSVQTDLSDNLKFQLKDKTLHYSLNNRHHIEITLFDPSGVEVSRPVDGIRTRGRHSASIENQRLAGGIYIARIKLDGVPAGQKIITPVR